MRIQLLEPTRWVNLLLNMNGLLIKHEILMKTLPLASDIFVFIYPIYLVALYVWGIYKWSTHRIAALFVFWSGWFAIWTNAIIKLIFTKTRPDVLLDLAFENRDGLVLEGIPANTFPSDHAAMSFAIATSTLLRWIKTKNKFFIWRSIILYLMAITMWIWRITIGIHRPTDIIAWTIIWILIPTILINKKIFWLLSKFLITPLILLQELVWARLFK